MGRTHAAAAQCGTQDGCGWVQARDAIGRSFTTAAMAGGRARGSAPGNASGSAPQLAAASSSGCTSLAATPSRPCSTRSKAMALLKRCHWARNAQVGGRNCGPGTATRHTSGVRKPTQRPKLERTTKVARISTTSAELTASRVVGRAVWAAGGGHGRCWCALLAYNSSPACARSMAATYGRLVPSHMRAWHAVPAQLAAGRWQAPGASHLHSTGPRTPQ